MSENNELSNQVEYLCANKRNKSDRYDIPHTLKKKAYRVLVDLEQNHDNSWAVESYLNQKVHPDKVALFYRGNRITTSEMYANAFSFAKSIKALGINKGDEVPVMISNSPEYVYMLLALDMIGAVINTVGQWFSPDYLYEIFEQTGCRYLFVSDDSFEYAKDAAERASNIVKIIMFSLTDSLPKDMSGINGKYKKIDDHFGHFRNKVGYFKKISKKPIENKEWFIATGADYTGKVVEDMTLDDACAITYTSGTTRPGYPKGCIHSNRNYLSLARFKKTDVSGMPNFRSQVTLAHLPSYTQTVLTTAYTDGIYMGWTIALEPYFEIGFYPWSLRINKPHYTVDTPEYEKYVAKLLDTKWKNVMMPYRVAVCVVGQALSPGLERYLNRVSKEHKFGREKLPFPLAPVTVSTAGGSSENGGIFVTLFKSLKEKGPLHLLYKEKVELQNIGLAEVEILSKTGKICRDYERGTCVVNTPTNQIGYVKEEFNRDTTLTDEHGKKWRTTGTPAYRNRFGEIRLVDRPGTDFITTDGSRTPMYIINDIIQEDTKNIMEAVIVSVNSVDGKKYICHIEKQPVSKEENSDVIGHIRERLRGKVHREILNNLYFRIHSFDEGLPVNGTGKTDQTALVNEGLTECCILY